MGSTTAALAIVWFMLLNMKFVAQNLHHCVDNNK
jgi:hypothetical protein